MCAALLLAGNGCSPMEPSAQDEEKEPHFVLGKSRVNAMNYAGAIEAFEESLEANPHSAVAHYQLAMLFENQESDPAAAIYHYQQYLKYDPKADNADIVSQHIASCKQQLATDVLQLPSAPAAQQQLEKLTEENRRLHDQLTQWQNYFLAQQAAAKTNPPTAAVRGPSQNSSTPSTGTSLMPEDVTAGANTPTATATVAHSAPAARAATARPMRTHTVARNETLASIARSHGVSLAALQAANPGVNPKKLKAGQVLNLPSP
ncbi:MAG TPA: LysM peptidoglycan-binding domain-containing protein [Verrucomicrobiae bacterium]